MTGASRTKKSWLVTLLGALREQLTETDQVETIDQLATLTDAEDITLYYDFCARMYVLQDSTQGRGRKTPNLSYSVALTDSTMLRGLYVRAICNNLTLSELLGVLSQLGLSDHHESLDQPQTGDTPSPQAGAMLARHFVVAKRLKDCPPEPDMGNGATLMDVVLHNKLKKDTDQESWAAVLSTLAKTLGYPGPGRS